MLVFRRQRQVDVNEFKGSWVYVCSSRLSQGYIVRSCLKQTKQNNKKAKHPNNQTITKFPNLTTIITITTILTV